MNRASEIQDVIEKLSISFFHLWICQTKPQEATKGASEFWVLNKRWYFLLKFLKFLLKLKNRYSYIIAANNYVIILLWINYIWLHWNDVSLCVCTDPFVFFSTTHLLLFFFLLSSPFTVSSTFSTATTANIIMYRRHHHYHVLFIFELRPKYIIIIYYYYWLLLLL